MQLDTARTFSLGFVVICSLAACTTDPPGSGGSGGTNDPAGGSTTTGGDSTASGDTTSGGSDGGAQGSGGAGEGGRCGGGGCDGGGGQDASGAGGAVTTSSGAGGQDASGAGGSCGSGGTGACGDGCGSGGSGACGDGCSSGAGACGSGGSSSGAGGGGGAGGASGDVIWSKHFPFTDFDSDAFYPIKLDVDETGSLYIGGSFIESVDFGGGPLIANDPNLEHGWFSLKLDGDGNHLWSQVPSVGEMGRTALNGELYTVGYFGPDPTATLAKYDHTGALALNAQYANRRWFEVTAFGGVLYVAGASGDYLAADLHIAKVDPANGAILWEKTIAAEGNQLADVIAVDPTGAIIVAGTYSGSPDLGGGPLPAGTNALYLAKFDAGGNHVWSQAFGAGSALDIGVDASGGIVLLAEHPTGDFGAGPTPAPSNPNGIMHASVHVVRFSASGALLGTQGMWLLAGDDPLDVQTVAVSPAGDHYLGIASPSAFDAGGGLTQSGNYAAAYTAGGALSWLHRFGSAQYWSYSAVALDPTGNVVFAGYLPNVAWGVTVAKLVP
jgi:hypothetical protein